MTFRRNFERAEDAQIHRKTIMLIGSIVLVILLINLAWNAANTAQQNTITVQMLHRDLFIIQADTTNYENFASTLKQAVIQAKKQYPNNQIQLTLPKTVKKSKHISDIIMIVTAMNLDWEIKN